MSAHPDLLFQASPDTCTPRIAVIVPCYNEALTIAGLIDDFRTHLPHARIYVFDKDRKSVV